MSLELPRLPPYVTTQDFTAWYSSFQVWWQKTVEAIENHELVQEGLIENLATTQGELTIAQAELETAQTELAQTQAGLAATVAAVVLAQAAADTAQTTASSAQTTADAAQTTATAAATDATTALANAATANAGLLLKAPIASPVFTGPVTFANGTYHLSADTLPRFFFTASGATLNRSGTDSSTLFDWRNASNSVVFSLTATGPTAITHPTTASAANMHIDSGSGVISRSTSSARFKTDIEDVDPQYLEASRNMRPRWFRSLHEADQEKGGYFGFIAEELAEVDPRLVSWGYERKDMRKDGTPRTTAKWRPQGLEMPAIVALQQARLNALEERLMRLEAA